MGGAHRLEVVAQKSADDGWCLLHTNRKVELTSAQDVLGHYKNPLGAEAVFRALKSYMKVRPVYHYRSDWMVNDVRICFLARSLSARLGVECHAKGNTVEVSCLLRPI